GGNVGGGLGGADVRGGTGSEGRRALSPNSGSTGSFRPRPAMGRCDTDAMGGATDECEPSVALGQRDGCAFNRERSKGGGLPVAMGARKRSRYWPAAPRASPKASPEAHRRPP